MQESIYFFAGMYPSMIEGMHIPRAERHLMPRSIEIVSKSCGAPYVYLDEMEARRAHSLARHHSGLYKLDPNQNTAERLQYADESYLAPAEIRLQARHLDALRKAI